MLKININYFINAATDVEKVQFVEELGYELRVMSKDGDGSVFPDSNTKK